MGEFTFNGDVERVGRIARGLKREREFNGCVAEAVLPVFERNLVALSGSNRNPYGARGGFWNRMLSGTVAVATAEAAIIRMPREVRLRHKGGTVTPKTARYLAIPLRAEAYGRSPRSFDDLHVVPARNGNLLLVRNVRTVVTLKADRKTGVLRAVDRGQAGGEAMYLLTRSATIRPNPAVLPPRAEIQDAALAGARTFEQRVLAES